MIAAVWGLYVWYVGLDSPGSPDLASVTVQKTDYKAIPKFDIILVQVDDEQAGRRVLTCKTLGCQPVQVPSSVEADAVSDGESWYRYVVEEDEKGEQVMRLQRTFIEDGHTKTILEQTPLVKPRGLYISPDGQRVAYWLDNIDNKEGLTELWVYDSAEGGVKVLAERLVKRDILTNLRWNRLGTALWFLVDSGEGEKEEMELVVVTTNPVGAGAQFKNIDLSEIRQIIDRGVMDISANGKQLALSRPVNREVSQIFIVNNNGEQSEQTVRGTVPYLQWLEDGSLIYAVQSGSEFIFWKRVGDRDIPISRLQGVLRSAYGNKNGEYIAFVADTVSRTTHAYVLQVASGLVQDQGAVPPYGQYVHIVYARQAGEQTKPLVASITTELSDAEIAAFLEAHLPQITSAAKVRAERIVSTNSANTVFVDYRVNGGESQRILLTVQDAVHPEWTIVARYQMAGGEWNKVQGGSHTDPKPVRVYEWEESVNQWVLKQRL